MTAPGVRMDSLAAANLEDAIKGILFEQDADAAVLLVHVAALEEPAIDLPTGGLARIHDRAAGRTGVILQKADEPELQGVNARDVPAVLQGKMAGAVLPPKIPELVIINRIGRQMAREKGAELAPARLGPRSQIDDRQAACGRPRAARQLVQCFSGCKVA